MKKIIQTRILLPYIAFAIIWTLIGHFFPLIHLLPTFIVLIIFFYFTDKYFPKISYSHIMLNYVLILAIYLLFHKFGGGDSDDAGRGWIFLSFIASLVTSSSYMVVNAIAQDIIWQDKIKYIGTMLISAIITFLICHKLLFGVFLFL
ncbi:MAG: hypothetical protein ACK5M3_03310 [Dysgonomonas sp.]